MPCCGYSTYFPNPNDNILRSYHHDNGQISDNVTFNLIPLPWRYIEIPYTATLYWIGFTPSAVGDGTFNQRNYALTPYHDPRR